MEQLMKKIETVKSDVNMSWKMVKIPEVLFFMEGPGVRNTQFTTKGVKLLNVGNINDGLLDLDSTTKFISETEAYGKYKHFLVEEGDLLIASSGIVVDNFHNKITWAKSEDLPLCMNTSTIRFKTLDSNILDIVFFSYFLKTKLFTDQLRKLITGSAQLNFGPSHLKQISLPLPPLPIQKRIAEILDTADALKRKDQALLKKYDELAQAIFIDMFGDPVKNEKGWEVKSLKSITSKIGSGATPTGGKTAYKATGISLIRSMNVYDFSFKWKDLAFIDNVQASKLNNVEVMSKDVLFNITGASVCRCSIVPDELLPARVNQHVAIIRAKTEILNPIFLNHLLVSNSVKTNLLGVGSGGGAVMEAITKDQLEQFEIIVPPIKLQNDFEQKINNVFRQKDIDLKSIETTNKLFQTLIQKAFKGELVAE
jgi:type I restriction enzyme S subunit